MYIYVHTQHIALLPLPTTYRDHAIFECIRDL